MHGFIRPSNTPQFWVAIDYFVHRRNSMHMRITRHYLDVNGRRVHYRKCGSGPTLILVHQSPRSSSEYEKLMLKWGKFFTCIAPDTPGYGQSEPLPLASPNIDDFGNALIEFLDKLNVKAVAVYGFHSGGAIAMNAHVRNPGRFTALACGGYPIWTEAEMALYASGYLPPFKPTGYGEHLTWVWSRVLEQSWFFPWFKTEESTRMQNAHDDVQRVNSQVLELLDAGDNYQYGYRAVLSAPSDIPSANSKHNPVLIATYQGDPLLTHLDRLPALPDGWLTGSAANPEALEDLFLSFLKEFPTPIDANFNADNDRGFIPVESAYFNGVIHWSGSIAANTLFLHNVGESIEFVSDKTVLAFDLPGHGLSGDISDSAALNDWAEIIAGAVTALGAKNIKCIDGDRLSSLLALAIAKTIGADCVSGTNAHIPLNGDKWLAAQPDLTPDRFGSHLGKAWQVVRSSQFFWPWFEARKTNAISFQQNQIDPEFLSVAHRALLRARSNTQLTKLLLNSEKTLLLKNAPKICNWNLADWAIERDDIWRP